MTDPTKGKITQVWLLVCQTCDNRLVLYHPQRGALRRDVAVHQARQLGWTVSKNRYHCPKCNKPPQV